MWAVPITINHVKIGAVICGQVLLWKPDELFWDELEQFHTALPYDDIKNLKKETLKLKIISAKQCQSSANLLSFIVKYMANTCDTDFMEQKSKMEWRNVILSRLEGHKKAHKTEFFNQSVYLKRERRFLQALRMADKEKSDQLIPLLFTDIEMLSNHHLEQIREMLNELMILSSRALLEAGIEPNAIQALTKEYRSHMNYYQHSEELFCYTYQIFSQLLDSAYLLINSIEHNSIIKTIRKYIEEHYMEKLTLDKIAQSVSLSPSYLSVLFSVC